MRSYAGVEYYPRCDQAGSAVLYWSVSWQLQHMARSMLVTNKHFETAFSLLQPKQKIRLSRGRPSMSKLIKSVISSPPTLYSLIVGLHRLTNTSSGLWLTLSRQKSVVRARTVGVLGGGSTLSALFGLIHIAVSSVLFRYRPRILRAATA